MDIVVDANITIALFVKLPYSSHSEKLFHSWRTQDANLYAPALWPAEVVSALRKMVSVGQMTSDDARLALASLEHFPVQVVLPGSSLLDQSLVWADRLNQIVAYDAQYVALADNLSAQFWTADQRLLNTLQHLNVQWAHWVEDLI
jgi:predicted nucleic acid-binding protein